MDCHDDRRIHVEEVDAADDGERIGERAPAEDLRHLVHRDADADARHVPDEDRSREEVGEESKGREAHPDEHHRDEQGQGRGQSDAIVGGDRQRHDRRRDERGGRGVRADDEPPRRTEHRVGEQRDERRVQAGLGRQARDLRVADAERDDQRRDRDAPDGVSCGAASGGSPAGSTRAADRRA